MRDDDPTTGRYLQADPLGLVDGASVYGYALGNPLRWTDPTGRNALALGLCTTGPQLLACAAGIAAAALVYYAIINICEAAWEWWVYSKPGGGSREDWRDSGDPPPSGHNQDPGGGDGGGLLAALAALTVLDGTNGFRLNEVDGNTVSITVAGQNGPIEILGEIGFNGSDLIIENVHIQGSGPGTSSISELREIGQTIGQATGASTVTVTGAPRTSGANPGKTPTVTIRIR